VSEDIQDIVHNFIKHSAENGDLTHLTEFISIGIVVDNDDELQQGRLRVFCPAYNDDPKKLLHIPMSAYVSPVGGVIAQNAYARGHIPGSESSVGAVHYGFWAIPEIGAHVLVACINGDSRRRVWMGCLPSHQETHTLGHGRFKHAGGTVNGPLTSQGNPIQPTYSKLQEAFGGDIGSAEWKTRGAEYQISGIFDVPSPDKDVYVDDDLVTIARNEDDSWVKGILGEHGYDWSGYKNLGSFLASRVQSWTTPGFHTISMDDRPFNSRIRVRTTGGNQIILDDTNERIYFSTSGGKSWIEMDAAGNIDCYAERRMSFHAEKDLNFSAGESIRFKSDGYISMYAGITDAQEPLESQLNTGEIRIHAADNLNVMVEGELQGTVGEDLHGFVGGTTDITYGDDVNIGVEGGYGLGALGNIDLSASDVTFTIAGKGTTINVLTEFLDTYVETYNDHSHVDAGANLNSADPILLPPPISIDVDPATTQIAPWTNRVPEHEPWPRVLKQDKDDPVNQSNSGYKNNVAWIDQFDNGGATNSREPIGKTEGDETVTRGPFWRR